MANDNFYNGPLGESWSELTPAERKRVLANSNAVFGKVASRPSTLYLEEASNLRRFTVYQHGASVGKTHTIDQAALDALCEYVTMDLIGAGVLRVDTLPPRRLSIMVVHIRGVCASWPR